jgi:phosphate transport system substrate-binding protein
VSILQNKLLRQMAVGAAAALSFSANVYAADISGAGATFPYPIYSKWAAAYKEKTGVGLNYQSIGSGGGIKQIEAKTVTFGASDMPLKPDVLDKAGLTQWPMVMGGEVAAINVKGIKPGELTIDGATLADIYLGKVKTWNDPALKKLNPNAKLPSTPIVVVHRSDGSGTTFIFTNYLSKVSPEWADKVGSNTSVEWPVGIGAKGNEGVAGNVAQFDGAIGYVEYAYAKQNHLTYMKMVNADGKTLQPGTATFQAAAANADWANAKDFYQILTNEPGATSWPITGATYILMHKQVEDASAAEQALKFFSWSYANGDKMAEALDYIPMPDNVVKLVEQSWKDNIKSSAGVPVWK